MQGRVNSRFEFQVLHPTKCKTLMSKGSYFSLMSLTKIINGGNKNGNLEIKVVKNVYNKICSLKVLFTDGYNGKTFAYGFCVFL